ncbi:Protein YLS2 [Morella rubra]|uniref:Protein YLS2 n=1 Tax=Morella rubra TaxID=262757 RepID=A0A6A1UMZ4_9ROSI|nr:Protein YLS2 [Morella rubra]
MSVSKNSKADSRPNSSKIISKRKTSWSFTFFVTALVPIIAGTIFYRLDSFDPAPLPSDVLTRHVVAVPSRNDRMLRGSELVGEGSLLGPEDVAYDPSSGVIYTGCADGWIYRVTVNDSASDMAVEKWINTGGRPLGIAVGGNGEVVVADSEKGLLKVTAEGTVEPLTDEANGQKFKLTDGVDVAHNGIVYFTDASYKYSVNEFLWDILEGKPHGRLLSYDPATKRTELLIPNLYFANGVAVSPDQNHVIFCETPLRRCRKYHLQGKEKGRVDDFVDNLPGFPDNIRYDGEGHYWIGLSMEYTDSWHFALSYPFIRKCVAIMMKYLGPPPMEKNGGVLAVDLAGKPAAHYYDPELSLVTSGIRIGDHLYGGSFFYPYIIRLNLNQHPAT